MAYAACSLSMPSSPAPERWIARAQPWLGTLVEVALPSGEAAETRFAAAFAAIEHVHRKMSPCDPASDLARIRRVAQRRAVVVHSSTYAVLQLALSLHRQSGGAFDPTVASARISALRLQGRNRVRATAPIDIDLGGIAKGCAVDCAVAALRASGAAAGLVNAGGDLRVFGTGVWTPVRLRHPGDPVIAAPLFELQDAAVATSGDYFCDGGNLIDRRIRRIRRYAGSVSVVAPSCMLADALTKIVALAPARARGLLASYGAHAFRLREAGGELHCATTFSSPTPHLRLAAALAA
jgi:FAD:protein FMN transferase